MAGPTKEQMLTGGVYNSSAPTLNDGQTQAFQLDVNGQLKVAATASVAPFAPNGNQATMSVSNVTSSLSLPAGTTVLVSNIGTTNTAYFTLSVGNGSATTASIPVPPGGAVGVAVGSNNTINAITASSTTSLNLAGGTGLVAGFGGGGGSTGSGTSSAFAAAFPATGTAIGAKSGANMVNLAADGSNNLLVGVATALPAGTNVIGHVIADSGSTTAVTQATGTNLHAVIDSGSTTAVTQATAANLKAQVTGAGSAGTADAGVVTVQGIASGTAIAVTSGVAQGSTSSGETVSPIGIRTLSTTPTDTTAQTNMPMATTNGALVTQPYALPDSLVSGATAAMTGTTTTLVLAAPAGSLHNYITQVTVGNSHATVGTFVNLQDGSGGTTIYTIPAAAVYGGATITFPAPLRQPTAATALYCACVTTGSNTIVSASGFKAL